MPTQTQSLIKITRGLLSVGLLFTGIFSFGSLTLVQTNAAQAHLADASCIIKGRPFFFENCWWQKKHAGTEAATLGVALLHKKQAARTCRT